MSWKLKTAFRDFKRVKEISGVLFRQGLGYYVHELKLKHHLFLDPKERGKKILKPKNLPENLRKSMDELGATFIKLGQLLSLRPDLIPEKYCEEFKKLQDEVSEVPFKDVKNIVESELKLKMDEVFSFFEERPLASASIGQVHRARLLNNENVVVKVQRPKIREDIEADIDIIYYLADLAKKHVKNLKNIDLNSIIKEFERYTENELDYLKESRYITKFYENFSDDSKVIIPKVFWDFTTSKVLVMSYIKGVKIDDKELLREEEHDIKIISANLADCFLKQVFEFGLFHADPHPANIFVCKGNKIGLLDYGIIGTLSEENKKKLTNVLIKLVERDMEGVLEGFLDLGMIESENEEALKEELTTIIDEYAGSSIEQVNVPRLFKEFLDVATKNQFKIPKDLVLLGKSIMTIEGVGQEIDPEFNISSKLSSYVEKLSLEMMSPTNVMKDFFSKINDFKKIFTKVPKQTSQILDKLNEGNLKVELEHKDLINLENKIDIGSNRVALSILIAALVVASSLLLNVVGTKLLSVVGYFSALILSLYLVASIYKERNIRV